MMKEFIVSMGCPGSGKTTFARSLSEKSVSCGDLYRKYHQDYSFLAASREKSKAAWIQALQKFIILALKREIKGIKGEGTVVIDGLWADNLADFRREIGVISQIYYLSCTKETARKRLLKRGRHDEQPRKIENRLDNYFKREDKVFDRLKSLDFPVKMI